MTEHELKLGAMASNFADELVVQILKIANDYEDAVPKKDRADFLATAICLTLGDLYEGREDWLIAFWNGMRRMEADLRKAKPQ